MQPLTYDKLTSDQIDHAMKDFQDWAIIEGALTQKYDFDSYTVGLAFATAVGYIAETLNHHPDIKIGYKNVVVSMVTHDADGGLTAFDFELARRISEIS